MGERLTESNAIRQGLEAYIHAAGIEISYGFFAPNVPNSYKLVFQIHYPDGRIEYELPSVSSAATGVRLTTLFDNIEQTQYGALRDTLLKMLAYSVWEDHMDARKVRVVFGYMDLPNAAEFERGKKESYHVLHVHDFVFSPRPSAHQ